MALETSTLPIILETRKAQALRPGDLLENLPTLCDISISNEISYATNYTIKNFMWEVDIIDWIIPEVTLKSSDTTFTRADFLSSVENNILLHSAGLDAPSVGKGLASVIDAS